MTSFSGFGAEAVTFLAGLSKHNEKKWFEANREVYETSLLEPARSFVSSLGDILHEAVDEELVADPRVGGSIFRIHRDTRFSKDKSPYKTYFDMVFARGDRKSKCAPGFFIRIEPDKVTLAGGAYDLSMVLERYRAAVADDETGKAVAKAVASASNTKRVGMWGESYKRVPRGTIRPTPGRSCSNGRGSAHSSSQTFPHHSRRESFPTGA